MGLVNGTISYLRFVANGVPEAFEEAYCAALREHRFHEIDPNSDLERSTGWVQFEDAFSSDWDAGTFVTPSGHVLLRLRVDTLKIPAVTLKAYVEQAARERCAADKRDKLIRREIDVLKLEVKKGLRKRSLPRMQLLEVCWTIATGEVRLMSTSRAAATLFVESFEKTFHQELKPVGLLSVLWLRGMDDAEIDHLAGLEPEPFHLARI
ncbi:MAG: hypothetical protein ACOYOB_09695 [Myxococcota bacterium]